VVSWRGRRIVSYAIVPLQVDAGGRAVRQLKSGTWEIRFMPEPADKIDAEDSSWYAKALKNTRKGDDRFGYMFLNGEMLQHWPTESEARPAGSTIDIKKHESQPGKHATIRNGAVAVQAAPPGDSRAPRASLLAPEIRIPVAETRLYRVTAQGLRDAGLLPVTPIQEDQIRLYQRRFREDLMGQSPPYLEVEVPIRMVGDGGDFSGEDFFLFHGLRPRDDADPHTDPVLGEVPGCGDPHETYNGSNIYWLAACEPEPGQSWARMAEISLPAASGPPLASYHRTDHFENDTAFREQVQDLDEDRNHYNDPFSRTLEVPVPVFSPDPVATDAQISLGFVGYSQTSGSRWIEAYLVDSTGELLLGSVNVNLLQEIVLNQSLDVSRLQDPTVTFRIQRPGATTRLLAFLDWIELSYSALYEVREDELLFDGGEATGIRDIEVSSFSTENLGMIELTDPHHPVWIALSEANIVTQRDMTTLSIQIAQSDGRRTFYASADMTGGGIDAIPYDLASVAPLDGDPTDVTDDPDLLVVTHVTFRETIDRWIEHRQVRADDDLVVQTVTAQQLYDWYSGGLKDLNAIKRFADFAIDNWGSWSLQLVGDANENVRGLGTAVPSPEYYNEPSDWVPTHLHNQNLGYPYPPELMMADDWYAVPYAGPNYPDDTGTLPEMYVGRFPCNTAVELDAMIDKVLAVEIDQSDQPWRKTAVFLADDAYSTSYTSVTFDTLFYSIAETEFEFSEERLATQWETLQGLDLVSSRFYLSDFTNSCGPPPEPHPLIPCRGLVEAEATPALIDMLNQGAMLVHFQGHSNRKVLTHEFLFVDDLNNRRDVSQLSNADKPWIFFGMGSHISEWGRNTAHGTTVIEPSLAEKLLVRNSGAVASYGSCGYEFLGPNSLFSEIQMYRFCEPPSFTVQGEPVRSRWVLGELVWAAEADLLALPYDVTRHRRMVAQYSLLGDASMVLDAISPLLTAMGRDTGEHPRMHMGAQRAPDATNMRSLTIEAVDEAGIARIQINRIGGNPEAPSPPVVDITDEIEIFETLPPGATTHQRVTYQFELPILPIGHDIRIDVFDTADRLETDTHAQLLMKAPVAARFSIAGGPPVKLGHFEFQPGVPLCCEAVIESSADLSAIPPDQLHLSSDDLVLTNVSISHRPKEPHLLDLAFTAETPEHSRSPYAVILEIGASEVRFELAMRIPWTGPSILKAKGR